MLVLIPITRHNGSGVCISGTHLNKNKDNCPYSSFPGTHYGDLMTEHNKEDQVAKYRSKLEETADLVARIRHEINNPLTGVLGQAQLLLREDLSERSRKRVQTIEDLAIRLRDIVAQLREVQRPSSEVDNDIGA
jgi:nitrogen-specific signal transduction histidine kinase